MKLLLGILTALLILSCEKKDNTNVDTLSSSDLTISQNMETEILAMEEGLNNLGSATNNTDRLHWDSLYHHHDSLFWVHHNAYPHEQYNHDDHHHQWTPYDATIDHHHHFHHPFQNHLNDSLVIIPNNHHHNNSDGHFPGHDLQQHQALDSVHHIHNLYHP